MTDKVVYTWIGEAGDWVPFGPSDVIKTEKHGPDSIKVWYIKEAQS